MWPCEYDAIENIANNSENEIDTHTVPNHFLLDKIKICHRHSVIKIQQKLRRVFPFSSK